MSRDPCARQVADAFRCFGELKNKKTLPKERDNGCNRSPQRTARHSVCGRGRKLPRNLASWHRRGHATRAGKRSWEQDDRFQVRGASRRWPSTPASSPASAAAAVGSAGGTEGVASAVGDGER